MGQTTPNMSIYVPAEGETNYGQAFLVGMNNVDSHDHSGAPNKGLPITSSGLGDFSVQYRHLNINVADTATGIQAGGGALANQLRLIGMVSNLYTLGGTADLGLICKTNASGAVAARTLTGTTNQIAVSNDQGVAGNPTVSLAPIVLNTTQPAFSAQAAPQPNVIGATASPDYIVQFSSGTPFNQGGYFDGVSTFTAPVTGFYMINALIEIGGLNTVGASRTDIYIYRNGAPLHRVNTTQTAPIQVSNNYRTTITQLMRLDATDTVQIAVNLDQGTGANTAGILGGKFNGVLLC